jgi:hypothetical protein
MSSPITTAPQIYVTGADDAAWEIPELGSAWTKVNTPTYSYDGLDLSANNAWYSTFGFDPATSSMSFKFRSGFNWNDSSNHDLWYDKQLGGFLAITKTSANKIQVIIWNYPTGSTYSNYYFNVDTAFASGDVVHVAILADNSGAAGQKIKLYINGTSQSVSSNSDGNFSGTNLGITSGGYNSPSGVVKHLQIYDYLLDTDQINWLKDHDSWEDLAPATPVPVLIFS